MLSHAKEKYAGKKMINVISVNRGNSLSIYVGKNLYVKKIEAIKDTVIQ